MNFDVLLPYLGIPKRTCQELPSLRNSLMPITQHLGASVYIYGGKGNGKTILASHILAETVRKNTNGGNYYLQKMDPMSNQYHRYYVPKLDYWFCWWPKLLMDVKRTFTSGYKGPTEAELVDRCLYAKYLVLDDIGIELTTDWAYQLLYLIVGHRYNENLPTIFTSNLPLTSLGEKYLDTRITSRIEGLCLGNKIQTQGSDKRLL